MTEPVRHGAFTIERRFDATPAQVFAAWSQPGPKQRWFAEGKDWVVNSYELDFRVGGHERSAFRFQGGPVIRNETVFQEIAPDRRIIFAYTMAMGQKIFSASLSTVQIAADRDGALVTFTEQAAFLEGGDGAAIRERGWRELLGKLDAELKAHAS